MERNASTWAVYKANEDIADYMSWAWVRSGSFKFETKSPNTTAQYQSIWTNYIKGRIDNTQENIICRICGQREKTVTHRLENEPNSASKPLGTIRPNSICFI